ncbi:hypothetical protein [Pseudonocardia asaccharolytica]|uniref:Uncharacterized protein n=1 Tax=Pseudonocardia asaccharolytica DSM 44247 = NBRC 16224 TaxID=1123024 RepID=A0A511CYS6_9PSEU|nr:hypothetical protein [Pseudonocardia asaccharolytica]GEL17709.1 hypothetical protein PA7_15460 [Pseudonocardia asaccharolytica DSM 44247 = NBRC 16224]
MIRRLFRAARRVGGAVSERVALIHYRAAGGIVRTYRMSAWYLDVEVHGGALVLTNGHGEQLRIPVAALLTLEIR